MTDAKPIFLDTNILAYATSPESPFHQMARIGLAELARAGRRGVISSQVIREYSASVTRPLPDGTVPPLAPVLANIARFRAVYLLVGDTEQVTRHAPGRRDAKRPPEHQAGARENTDGRGGCRRSREDGG